MVRGQGGLRRNAVAVGLCGLLSPALAVGDVLLYHDVRHSDRSPVTLDGPLTEWLAARLLPRAQSGIRALASDAIVTHALEKRTLGARHGADALDMETFALAGPLQRAGVSLAAVRVGSDGAGDDLPDLDWALGASGHIDARRLALALLRKPRAGIALVRHAIVALRALERAVYDIARP